MSCSVRRFASLLLPLALLTAAIWSPAFGRSAVHAARDAIAAGDDDTALSTLARPADKGNPEALYLLSTPYRHGRGVPLDAERSLELLRRSTEGGFGRAQFELGQAYLDGTGVPGDDAEARRWFESAAGSGNLDARVEAARMLFDGRGGDAATRDALRAFELATDTPTLAAAAEAMSEEQRVEADHLFGLMLAQAFGTPQDLPAALKWLEFGGRGNDPDVRAVLSGIRAALGPQGVDRVEAHLASWKPGPWRPEPAGKVQPDFPEPARVVRLGGYVIIQAIVSTDGRVVEPCVLRTDPAGYGFEQSALDAVTRWRYEPARRDGEPVEVYFTINIEFSFGS